MTSSTSTTSFVLVSSDCIFTTPKLSFICQIKMQISNSASMRFDISPITNIVRVTLEITPIVTLATNNADDFLLKTSKSAV